VEICLMFPDGGGYQLDLPPLQGGETRAIDLKRLRATAGPDVNGDEMPRRQGRGMFMWKERRPGLIGRAVVYSVRNGISHNMSCPSEPLQTACIRIGGSAFSSSCLNSPGTVTGTFGETRSVSVYEVMVGCCSGAFAKTLNITSSSQIFSYNPSIVRVIGNQLQFVGAGQTTVDAQFDTWVPECWCDPEYIAPVGEPFCSCVQFDSRFDTFFSPLQVVQVMPRVTVTGADVCSDSITTRLEPNGFNGVFTLTLVSSGGSVNLVNQQARAGGNHTDSFNVSSLPNRTFTSIQATWRVDNQTGTGTRQYSITVLGDYTNTCYITASESDFSGATVVAGTATSQCVWSSREFITGFLDAVNLNGSGIDSGGTAIQIESFCSNPPATSPAYNGRRYRRPTTIRTSCGNSPTAGVTVASSSLNCGTRIFINGIGCRTVQDTGGGLAADQIDNYRGVGNSACAGWSNARRKVIRIN
jgi:3D (Asp-Asp-Asp) domain-containing protein